MWDGIFPARVDLEDEPSERIWQRSEIRRGQIKWEEGEMICCDTCIERAPVRCIHVRSSEDHSQVTTQRVIAGTKSSTSLPRVAVDDGMRHSVRRADCDILSALRIAPPTNAFISTSSMYNRARNISFQNIAKQDPDRDMKKLSKSNNRVLPTTYKHFFGLCMDH